MNTSLSITDIIALIVSVIDKTIPFICAIVGWKLKEFSDRKASDKVFKVNCFIIGYEITKHRDYLEKSKNNTASLLYFKSCSMRVLDDAAPNIYDMTQEELQIIFEHISTIRALHTVMQDDPKPVIDDIDGWIESADKAVAILIKYTGYKEFK